MDLEEPPDSCERTGALVLWLSCEGQTDVWELFSDNSYLSAILDRQGLMVAAPADLRIKSADSFSPQALQSFWSKKKLKNPKIVVMSPTVFTECTNQTQVIWQQDHWCLAIAEYQILDRKQFLIVGPKSGKIWWLKEGAIPSEEVSLPMDSPARKATHVNFDDLSQPVEFVSISRERFVPTEWHVHSVLGDWKSKAQWLPGSCKFELTRGSNTGHELDQGPTRRVETLEPSSGH